MCRALPTNPPREMHLSVGDAEVCACEKQPQVIPGIVHDLRHTHATLHLEAQVDVTVARPPPRGMPTSGSRPRAMPM